MYLKTKRLAGHRQWRWSWQLSAISSDMEITGLFLRVLIEASRSLEEILMARRRVPGASSVIRTWGGGGGFRNNYLEDRGQRGRRHPTARDMGVCGVLFRI